MMKLRPDGILEIDDASVVGAGLLALVKDSPAGADVDVVWLRNLVADHVRRIVAATEDGAMPSEAACANCRPDALARLAILASVPPMTGGEYWNDDVLFPPRSRRMRRAPPCSARFSRRSNRRRRTMPS